MRIALVRFSFWPGLFSDSGVVPVIIFHEARHLDTTHDNVDIAREGDDLSLGS